MWQPISFTVSQSTKKRRRYVDEMLDKVSLDDDDKKKSRAYADEVLTDLISHAREQQFGEIYGHQIVKAGSYPINAKIGKADEFDTNIIFNVEPTRIFGSGKVCYRFEQVSMNQNAAQANIQANVKLVKTSYDFGSSQIPNGYVVVEVNSHNVPPIFQHVSQFGYMQSVVNNSGKPFRIHLLPHDVKQDLHKKIRTARDALGLSGVSISNACHGPALTLTITPSDRSGIKHKISVDVTASLKCSLQFKNWPRPATRNAFDEDLIHAVFQAGIHLVPKKDLFWAISYSRAERALLSSVDKGFGCRKRTLKLLKKYFAVCQSRSTSKLPGISSHVLKTQVLWSCERHADEADYWNQENRDICLINTMLELVQSLQKWKLDDYFDVSINLLEGKDPNVLAELANFMYTEMANLSQIA